MKIMAAVKSTSINFFAYIKAGGISPGGLKATVVACGDYDNLWRRTANLLRAAVTAAVSFLLVANNGAGARLSSAAAGS